MNLIEFNKILSNPSQINKGHIKGLSDILEEYPYFQVAHFLHLNGLKNQHSFKYNDSLKKTAAYTSDRSVLFDYIASEDYNVHPAPANIPKKQTEQKEEGKKEALTSTTSESPEETLKIGQPLQFNSNETHSFREWMQLIHFKPIERNTSLSEGSEKAVSKDQRKSVKSKLKMDLIDNFIASKPKIGNILEDTYSDAAMDSVMENESLMTETLAHVYVEQKKYTNAITAFTVLSLKYPEKSSFFALQIEAIKKLQAK